MKIGCNRKATGSANRNRAPRSPFTPSAGSTILFLICLASPFRAIPAADWQTARPGWTYAFPRDHLPHGEFKTEWWYFTGNLQDRSGRHFGYQLTFFRQGIRPPSEREGTSRLLVNELPFAHFCISDPAGERFDFHQKMSRGAFGTAGFGDGNRLAWIDNWSLTQGNDGSFLLRAGEGSSALSLELLNAKSSWAIHGLEGVSQKAAGEGHASHYYSGTRMNSSGSITLGGRKHDVSGLSWFDHEWATNQLTAEQSGWNWFSMQFDDGSELMLYQMRLRDGGIDPQSSGTFVSANGETRHLTVTDYQLNPARFWTSRKTGGKYPIAWSVIIPNLDVKLDVTTPLDDQELSLPSISYWEGLIDIQGRRNGKPVHGQGYLELTGYTGNLVGLSEK